MNGTVGAVLSKLGERIPAPKTSTLTFKLLLPVLLVWLVTALILFALFTHQLKKQGYADLQARLDEFASAKEAELTGPVWSFQDELVERLMQSYRLSDDLYAMSLYGPDGKMVQRIEGSRAMPHTLLLTVSRQLTYTSGGQDYDLGRLEVQYHDGRLATMLSQRRERDFITLALIMAVLCASVWMAMHLIVGKPLAKIEASLRRNASGSNREKLVWTSRDELGKVVEAYNGLIAEVDRSTGELRQTNEALTREIVRRAQAEEELRLAAKVFEVSIEGIFITDPRGYIQTVNASFERITGYASHEVAGRHSSLLKSGLHPPAFFTRMWKQLNRDGSWAGEISNRRKHGEVFPQMMTISAVRDVSGDVSHYVTVFQDITELKKQQQDIEFQAYHDSLTGLPNRTNLDERLGQALGHASRRGSRVAVLFLDLDNFKAINDSLGHDVGDRLLAVVAERMKTVVRTEDTLARLGGDEFIVLMRDVESPEDASHVAARIQGVLSQSVPLKGYDIQTSASIGIAIHPLDGATPPELIKNADLAMYRAKSKGGGNWQFFTPDMDAQAQRRLTLEASLHKAMERDELEIYYQPVISMENGGCTGVEALLRWNVNNSVVKPSEFIPVAESTGAIIPIGSWVLSRSCQQALRFKAHCEGEFSLAVNVSVRQFVHGGFISDVAKIMESLDDSGLRLNLEITESALIKDMDSAARKLKDLKALGASIWLDDFGTGYSSLTHLKDMSIDGLKIDRSFVWGIGTCERSRAIVSSVIHLARGIGADVVAEGVEDAAQLEFLRARGCLNYQGFLACMPLPTQDLERYLVQGRCGMGLLAGHAV